MNNNFNQWIYARLAQQVWLGISFSSSKLYSTLRCCSEQQRSVEYFFLINLRTWSNLLHVLKSGQEPLESFFSGFNVEHNNNQLQLLLLWLAQVVARQHCLNVKLTWHEQLNRTDLIAKQAHENVSHENVNKWPPLLLRFSLYLHYCFVKWTPKEKKGNHVIWPLKSKLNIPRDCDKIKICSLTESFAPISR